MTFKSSPASHLAGYATLDANALLNQLLFFRLEDVVAVFTALSELLHGLGRGWFNQWLSQSLRNGQRKGIHACTLVWAQTIVGRAGLHVGQRRQRGAGHRLVPERGARPVVAGFGQPLLAPTAICWIVIRASFCQAIGIGQVPAVHRDEVLLRSGCTRCRGTAPAARPRSGPRSPRFPCRRWWETPCRRPCRP